MIEYIKRDAAIDEIARFVGYIDQDMIYRIQTRLAAIPSADVQQAVRGKWQSWNEAHPPYWSCDVCGFNSLVPCLNYCPNCGANMREGC